MRFVSHRSEVLAELSAACRKAMTKCGGVAVGHAQDICPVDTGNLRRSIKSDVPDDRTVVVGTPVKYAPFVELGHHQQPGRYVPAIGKRLKASYVPGKPFIRPAAEEHGDEYRQIIENELQNG